MKAFRIMFAGMAAFLVACSGDSPSDPGPQPVQYGTLIVTVSGLPAGASGNITVTGPGGYSRSLTATSALETLAAGSYTVAVSDVAFNGSTYTGSPASQSYTVAAGATVTTPNVSYAIATGSLSVTVAGLPQSTTATILITGPDGYSRSIDAATDIVGLKPGDYTVAASEVQLPNVRYAATPGSQQVVVVASPAPAVASVVYAQSTGSIQLNITGLPQGIPAAITITGPNSYSQAFTAETVVGNLSPGLYTITAANVSSTTLFTPAPTVQQVVVTAGTTASVANVFYVSSGTALNVVVTGLPAGVPATVTINGPSFSQQLTASQLFSGVSPGTYTITVTSITTSCTTYTPSPPAQTVTVVSGQATTATVNYGTGGGGLNLCIDGAYITQSIQTYDNAVPLVAGRGALIRVFVRASTSNSAQASVRVRFYNASGTLVNTTTIPPQLFVPTAVDEATISTSWNATLTSTFLQPGMRWLVDVDPSNTISEASESDNTYPANGTPALLDVRTVAPLNVTLVPIIQTARGDTGRVDENNKANFIGPLTKMFPVATVNADVRLPYTYNGAELQSGGTNWTGLLQEINALRVAEATGKMYYGVLRVGYTSGVAGLGYIGLPAAIGWDYQPSGTEVLAHELGHNFGRFHAPCGGPSGPDPSFPYAGATIGVYGYDIVSSAIKLPSLRDLMSYCDPHWISDYTYQAILNYRQTHPMVASASTASQRGLLVWGRIQQGQVILEPAIEVDAPASLPRGGPHRVEGFGPTGETLFSYAFTGDQVADAPDPNEQTFAFVVPMSQLRGKDLARMRLSALGRQAEQRSTGGGTIPSAQRTTRGRVRVTWDASAARVALVRDARTGQILSFARGGSIDLPGNADDLDITLSDGVKSIRSRLRPR